MTWGVVGGVLVGVAALMSALLSIAAFRANRSANAATTQLAGVKQSIESLEAALARADVERESQRVELVACRERDATTRKELDRISRENERIQRTFDVERRMMLDRVKVLARENRRLGGTLGDEIEEVLSDGRDDGEPGLTGGVG